nr:MAG TPA: Large Terminase [Caudoviricetes sp.]
MYEKAYEYCTWSLDKNNTKVPKYVKKQCKQFVKIWDDKDKLSIFDHNKAKKIEKLLQLINVPKGAGTGKSVIHTLTGFQWLLLVAPFCVVLRDDHNKRRYENIVLEICRKNAKSYVSALICLILMILEPKFSRFFTVSSTGALSRETFKQIKEFVSVSPALEKHFKLLRDNIICKLTESEYTPLNYSTGTLDGRLPNAFLGDEVGSLPCSYPLEAMRSGQVLLNNKLGIIMSTKYPTVDNPFEDEVDYCKKVLDEVLDDPNTFGLLYEPDNPNGNWQTDDDILAHGNPLAIDVPVLWDNLIKKRDVAIEKTAARSNFLTKHCNIITADSGTEEYINIQDLKQCRIDEFDWNGREVYVGLDLSLTNDNTSVVMVTRDEYGHLVSKPMCFIPTDNIDSKTKEEKCDYYKYIDLGSCIACGTSIIDYSKVENYIIATLQQDYNVTILGVGYDRYNAISTVNKLEEAGLDCIEVKQHSSVLASPTKLLYEEITTHNFRYETNQLYEINFVNAVCTYDTNLNRYVHKKKSRGKVDMVVATLNAVCLLQQAEIYDDQWVCS